MRTLNPFIDSDGLLRAGGRLINADIAYTSKCPILLPAKSKTTQLIFEYEHKRLIHIGLKDCTLTFIFAIGQFVAELLQNKLSGAVYFVSVPLRL